MSLQEKAQNVITNSNEVSLPAIQYKTPAIERQKLMKPKNQLILSHQPEASPFSDYSLEKEKIRKIESLLYRVAPKSQIELQNMVAGVRSDARRVPQNRYDRFPAKLLQQISDPQAQFSQDETANQQEIDQT